MDFDIYQTITDRMIEQLNQGIIPWQKPWVGYGSRGAYNRVTGNSYSLLNQMLLGMEGEYMSYKQVQEAGGRVKKGAKSSMVVFWKMLPRDKTDKDGNPVPDASGKPKKEMIPFLRYSNVFHISQTEGITPRFEPEPKPNGANSVQKADDCIKDYCSRCNLIIQHIDQARAFYSPATDSVTLPLMEQFFATAEFYSTTFHELVHSTGHESRLNRPIKNRHGSEDYAKEELVAEIGAASILNFLGMETEDSFKNSTAYVQSWLSVLRHDKRLIVSAAGRAEKAANLILNIGQSKTQSCDNSDC